MKLLIFLCLTFATPFIGAAAPLVNDGSIYSVNWSSVSNFTGFATAAGTGGTSPSLSGGVLTLSMEGATAGSTSVYKNLFDTGGLSDYIVTTRLAINQFPGNVGSANAQNVNITRVLDYDTLSIGLTPTQVLIGAPSGGITIDLTGLGLNNDEGVFYTWQFEVHQDIGAGAGSVTVYRRDNDLDSAWSLIASDISILNRTTTPPAVTQTYFGNLSYSNTGDQAVFEQQYWTLGVAVPEPSVAILLPAGIVALLAFRRIRRTAKHAA